jgi:hypothetical protein
MQSVSRGQSPAQAIAEYRRLLARDDLAGEPWAAVLRDDLLGRTLLFSRFDSPEQRLLPSDTIDLQRVFQSVDSRHDADAIVSGIVSERIHL